ncbi:unnamed protein product [Ranitomeya imitator]|uniref:MADF domain-containing protein n=1 Tax=Ranitomeya imitator TaxID=111125 RepID=A0ABN9M758_9NEOB|nr:unnamed protein product [Ranitomeya imitator]
MVVDDEEKANILNTFFSTVFTVENEMLGEIPRNNENPILRVTNLTQEEVRNRLNKIKIDKSPGPDGIHPRVLRELSNVIDKPLFLIFRDSIATGSVPQDWRIANVVPIFKKGSKSEPGNYRPMSANEQDCVRALIEMYRSLPCLWKIKSADYSNRYKKKDAYEKLVAIYKEHHPTETVDEHIVRKKIQALRTVYKKELNKVEKSLKSGARTDDVYVPKLWYYDLLAFTRDQEIPRPCQTVTSICAPSPEENLPESPDEHVPLQQRERPEGNDVQSHQSSRSPCLEDQTRPQRPSRKRKSTAGTPVDLLAMANNILSKHAATQLSAFPTLVEERLNKLDVTQRSHAERLMFDVLNAAAAGKLSDTSMLNITDRQPSSQFYLGPPQEPMHSTPVRRPGPHHSQFWTPPAPPSFADFSQGPPTSTHRYSEMDTYYQNL